MLKNRIIPIQLLSDGRLVKGRKFGDYRDVGDPVKSSHVYSMQDADELILLNIDGHDRLSDLIALLPKLSEQVFMPISIGGGIRSYSDAAMLIKEGADKVVLNSVTYNNYSMITDIANDYGCQSVAVCIDVREIDGTYLLFSENGHTQHSVSLDEHIETCIEAGAGEIILQSIDLDGSMRGFDLCLALFANKYTTTPFILAGGSGDYSHIKDVFLSSKTSAVACGSLFNFSDSSPIRAKHYLKNYGVNYKRV